jgi:hypothetical protein
LGNCLAGGFKNLDAFLHTLKMKLVNPESFYLIRGDHESILMTQRHGEDYTITKKYSNKIYYLIIKCCQYMPILAVVNDIYWCAYGGIPYFPKDQPHKIKWLNEDRQDRLQVSKLMPVVLRNILWSWPVVEKFKTSTACFKICRRNDDEDHKTRDEYNFTKLGSKQFLKKIN